MNSSVVEQGKVWTSRGSTETGWELSGVLTEGVLASGVELELPAGAPQDASMATDRTAAARDSRVGLRDMTKSSFCVISQKAGNKTPAFCVFSGVAG